MSAAVQITSTPRERLLETVLDQLTPMYAMIYDGDMDTARQAAADAMDSYVQDERADLAVAGQIIACGLTTMRILQNCMRPEISEADLARLTRTADTLSRTAQRARVSGLYPPAEPKPAAGRAPNLRVVPPPVTEEMQASPDAPAERQPQAEAPEPTPCDTAADDAGLTNRALRDRILASSALSGSMTPEQTEGSYIFSTTGIPNSPK